MSLLRDQLSSHRTKNPLPPPSDARTQRATILHADSPLKASDVDPKLVFERAKASLLRLDPTLTVKYSQTLFSSSMGCDNRKERHLLPQSEKEKVDEAVRALLRDVPSRIWASEDGMNVLEFLLQRFFVHVVSPQVLLEVLLPLHETKLFKDVTRVFGLDVRNSPWEFVLQYNKEARLTRARLVEQCFANYNLLNHVAASALNAVDGGAFFAALACEVLEKAISTGSTKKMDECVKAILPHAAAGMKSASPQTTASCRMVLCAMAKSVTLSRDAVDALLSLLAKRIKKTSDAQLAENAKCALFVYEWQASKSRTRASGGEGDEQLYYTPSSKSAERLFNEKVIQALLKAECETTEEERHASLLVTWMIGAAVCQTADETLLKLFSEDVVFKSLDERSRIVLDDIATTAVAQKKPSPNVSLLVQTISSAQPLLFEQYLASSIKLNPTAYDFFLVCFPENSPFRLGYSPFENDTTLSLALRDGNPRVRLRALEFLVDGKKGKKSEDALAALFSNHLSGKEDCLGVVLVRNAALARPSTPEDVSTLKLIFSAFSLLPANLPNTNVEALSVDIKSIARRLVILDESNIPQQARDAAAAVLMVKVGPLTLADEDLFALHVAGDEYRAVFKGTWLELASQGKYALASKKLQGEVQIESVFLNKLRGLYEYDAKLAVCILSESLMAASGGAGEQRIELYLNLLNDAKTPAGSENAQGSAAQVFASKESLCEVLIAKSFGATPERWKACYFPLVSAVFSKSKSVDAICRSMENICFFVGTHTEAAIATDKNEETRKVVRALRMLKAMYESRGGLIAGLTAVAGTKSKDAAAKKSSEDKCIKACSPALFACARHRPECRLEGMKFLEDLIPTSAMCVLIVSRKNEIERDSGALARAFSSPEAEDLVKLVGAAIVECCVTQGDELELSRARGLLDCVALNRKCASDALQALLKNESSAALLELVADTAFRVLGHTDISDNTSIDGKTIETILVGSLRKVPHATCRWLSKTAFAGPVLKKGSNDLFDSLLEAACANEAVNPDVVEQCGRILGTIEFEAKHVFDRLNALKTRLVPSKTAAASLVDDEALRRICLLIESVPGKIAFVKSKNGSAVQIKDFERTLLEIAKDARSRSIGVLERVSLIAVERFVLDHGETAFADWLHPMLIEATCDAGSEIARWTAIRAFRKSNPDWKTLADALRLFGFRSKEIFQQLVEELCSSNKEFAGALKSNDSAALTDVLDAFTETVQRLRLPKNERVVLLHSVAKWSVDPSRVLIKWMRASWNIVVVQVEDAKLNETPDFALVVASFDAREQTQILVDCLETDIDSATFVARHLASKGYMSALVAAGSGGNEESDSSTPSVGQFLHLLHALLKRLATFPECDASSNKRQLEKALDNLSALLSVPMFVAVVSETLSESADPTVRRSALRVVRKKVEEEHMDWSKEETLLVVELADTLIRSVQQEEGSSGAESIPITTLLALDSLAAALAQQYKDVFVRVLPRLSQVLSEEHSNSFSSSLKCSACLLVGTIGKRVGTMGITHYNALLPNLLRFAKTMGRDEDGPLLRQSAISALKDLVESKSPIIPFLGDILEQVALKKGNDDAIELLDIFGASVEPRLGFDLCLKSLREAVSTASSSISFEKTIALLDRFVARSSSVDAVAHFKDFKELWAALCGGDHSYPEAGRVALKMGLLLNESMLNELVDSLIDRVEDGKVNLVAVLDVLRALLEGCGQLFLPVFPVEFVLRVLENKDDGAALLMGGDGKSSSATKRRRTLSLDGSRSAYEPALRCVAEALAHAVGTGFIEPETFERLLPVLVQAVKKESVPLDLLESSLASLASCVVSSPYEIKDAQLQTLHHSVTKLLKSSSSRVRRDALSCVTTLFERVGSNGYLVLLPDTLPFLVELLEDDSEEVVLLAQRLGAVMKNLSGEDISNFLKRDVIIPMKPASKLNNEQ